MIQSNLMPSSQDWKTNWNLGNVNYLADIENEKTCQKNQNFEELFLGEKIIWDVLKSFEDQPKTII